MVVQNMPGAGNVLATNYMFNIAPKDGTKIAVVNNAIPLNQMLDGKGVRYDTAKFNWLGSPVKGSNAIIVLASTGVKTMEDFRTKQVITGGIGAGSSNVIWPTAMNNVLGTKFKVVAGYNTGPDLWLAMERGETEARTGSYSDLASQRPQWIKDKKVVVPAQLGNTPDKDLPGVPMISDLAKTEEQRKIMDFIFSPIDLGQPYLAPPDTTPDNLAVLRQAFQTTLRDPGFLAEAKKMDFDIDPISAEDITRFVQATVNASPDIVAKAKEAMRVPGAPE
jgi:tripartite-type tricarboxylate transporter receptor subunit TctC